MVTTSGLLRLAAALTDAGLLLILVAGAVAIIAFLLFVVREALSRPVEVARELAPPQELPPIAENPGAGAPPRPPGASPPGSDA